MSCVYHPDAGMTTVVLGKDDVLHLEIVDSVGFRKRLPTFMDLLVQYTAVVNHRLKARGEQPIGLIFL
jgi:hypothetical protein